MIILTEFRNRDLFEIIIGSISCERKMGMLTNNLICSCYSLRFKSQGNHSKSLVCQSVTPESPISMYIAYLWKMSLSKFWKESLCYFQFRLFLLLGTIVCMCITDKGNFYQGLDFTYSRIYTGWLGWETFNGEFIATIPGPGGSDSDDFCRTTGETTTSSSFRAHSRENTSEFIQFISSRIFLCYLDYSQTTTGCLFT